MWIQSLSWEDTLEKGITTHSHILARRIQWTEEPGRLRSMGLDTTEATEHSHMHVHIHILYIYIYIYIFFFQNLFHYRVLQDIEFNSLCYTVSPDYLFLVF